MVGESVGGGGVSSGGRTMAGESREGGQPALCKLGRGDRIMFLRSRGSGSWMIG